MKVVFSHNVPFFLAHGGVQTVADSLMRELPGLGVEVEPARWWDDRQRGDVLHYICRPTLGLEVGLAQEKGFKVVMTEFLDQTGSRSRSRLRTQKLLIGLVSRVLPGFTGRLSWEVYKKLDAMVYAVPHEWEVAKFLFGAHPDRGHIVPHGLEASALAELAQAQPEQDYLVSMATITARKNTVLLAQAARQARVPVLFLGKPYSETDGYFRTFQSLVDGQWVRYPGFVTEAEKRRYLRGARGFVLLSQFESGCIAVFEAAAAGLPMLLTDLPWASKVYGSLPHVQLAGIGSAESLVPRLAGFYAQAHRLKQQTFTVHPWREIARQYLAIYQGLLQRGGSEASR